MVGEWGLAWWCSHYPNCTGPLIEGVEVLMPHVDLKSNVATLNLENSHMTMSNSGNDHATLSINPRVTLSNLRNYNIP